MAKLDIDRDAIYAMLEKLRQELGDEMMSGMKLLTLETKLRQKNLSYRLPGKTVLRECIHRFRTERWPNTAPRKFTNWTR